MLLALAGGLAVGLLMGALQLAFAAFLYALAAYMLVTTLIDIMVPPSPALQ